MKSPAGSWVALLILGLQPLSVSVAGLSDDAGRFDMSDDLSDNRYGFLPVPVVITEPAVGYGGGAVGLFLHDSPDSLAAKSRHDGRTIPPAMTAFGGGATQNGTWFVGGGHRHTWNNDGIRYLAALGYADINLDIYSGDISGFDRGKGVSTQTKGYGGMQKLLFRVADTPFFVGGSQFYASMEISADNPFINRALQRVLGEKSATSGVGLLMEYDTTDNFFYPRRGLSVTGEYQFYTSFLGGDYRYNLLTLNGKYFHPLGNDFTLALAGNYQSLSHQSSHLPPMARPYIQLRGISRYRYQADYVSTVQTQLEWQMTPRWTLQGFVGAGSASKEQEDLYQQTEVAWGGGFRYLVARQFGLHTGIDIAFSDNEQALYFNVGAGL
ncbi:BamA/TamA family outer membrane protein [Enterobacteriaceae bacterium H18W14]|uniref:BamA/TamA family outer membrane protein n=1 Tax=Dryocola boscaweniae TaxID=2925397 RepID=UPI0022F12C40|nr:BamA/TamA family outer membrane protein [Dryocola boscaweniae]MCT4714249.1 BamA/TamA family outer membrane protein [Dryocola boscaweniae]